MKNFSHIQNEESRYFLETGISGVYDFTEVTDESEIDGKACPLFDDSLVIHGKENNQVKRTMFVDGRTFHICSVLPWTDVTPTDRLLQYIDSDIERGSASKQIQG